ncbi:MAG: metallophosphoesterase [Chloroflexaceae bacterium]|nr:metallophosphoesterase [Chloroflexaceae bacterium]
MVYRWGSRGVRTWFTGFEAAALVYARFVEPRRPVLERRTLCFRDLPAGLDGLRIGQLTDLHLGFPYGYENTRWAVERMVAEQPDLLVFTGDMVARRRCIPDLAGLLRPLQARLGMYSVPGNHDIWEGAGAVRDQLALVDITTLLNRRQHVLWDDGELWIAGIDDMCYGQPDLEAAVVGIPEAAFTLLLAHAPDIAPQSAEYRVDLQLSGHTHGGQVDIPLIGPLTLPYHGLAYARGWFAIDQMQLYVSRGLGGLPMRLNCPPEATILTLRRG